MSLCNNGNDAEMLKKADPEYLDFDPKEYYGKNLKRNNKLAKKQIKEIEEDQRKINTYKEFRYYSENIEEISECNEKLFKQMCLMSVDKSEMNDTINKMIDSFSYLMASLICCAMDYAAFFMSCEVANDENIVNYMLIRCFWIYDLIIRLTLKYFRIVEKQYVFWEKNSFVFDYKKLKNKDLLKLIVKSMTKLSKLTDALREMDKQELYNCFTNMNMEKEFNELLNPFEL